MIKVYHYSNSFAAKELHVMTKDFGPSNTDKSFYTPEVVNARSTLGSGVSQKRVGVYDFPDGKDTGERIQVILRQKGLDVAEIDRIGAILKSQVESDKTSLEHIQEMEAKDITKYVKSIADAISDVSSASDASTANK